MKGTQVIALVVVLIVIAGIVVAKSMGGKDTSAPLPADASASAPPAASVPGASEPASAEATVAENAPSESANQVKQEAAYEPNKQAEKALPTMLELGSVGCRPCEYMAPIIDSLSKELAGKVIVEFHDVNRDPTLADKYQIMVIPTQVFLDANGKELFRHTGIFEKSEILAKMRELGMLKE